ncbi:MULTISPECIES: sensor histidine kinase [Rhizobium]|uniref:histidine kinase n=1 Tax=Rhizobium johnstonii (strain DSM 114642 / LMG 32736 / 3841) TaxID=216596 RepID=Q1MF13_RHIJ3|nr:MULTISPECIES: HAMP domain-containing sensor histidine kinase [Rhizobium]MBB4504606.1 signal transduction histidine kinase [Rhizobium leguminosarum]MBY5372353.1 HAMP domain-containing histidine kinase [Rhizobium leguminosarum]MBY5386707.1 HAMP domain-containing histidine kinase [Rhizobium leguminosarum]MBY5414191.1 HAMP domain-containing histidine kinase [Rhizobium leguminosarum]MBY5429691.1 HAMP domain-containing histidine kinase [Rhizobium leguminosarum]
MAKAQYANPSLWWRLSWQLSLVFVAVVAAVIVGLCVYGAMILSPNVGTEDKLTAVLDEALGREADGRLVIIDSPRLRSLKAEAERLWFIVADQDGRTVSYGAIPEAYRGLADYIRLIKEGDIRGARETEESASIDAIETRLGAFRVMYGGNPSRSSTFLTMLIETYPIYIPLLAVALPAVFLAVPRIVGRALRGISDVAREAAEIEPLRQGARLPVNGIPREVSPLVTAFNGALERLETEFRKRQRFLIDAAHELRTPIAIMQTRIDGMPDGRERQRLLDDVARLAEAAEQLLDFERNDQAADLDEIVDLVDIARTVVADLAPLAITAGYQICFQSKVESLERRGSPSALPRAVSNLVRNAIDHGGNSGMITVSVSASGAGRISVADEGPGIPAEHRQLVFEPFYRVTPKSRGAGLGLSLVKQVAANHGGGVSIESSAAGTRVTIELASVRPA